jgi:glycerol-3-phosphate acyltransferase PlsY
MTILAILTVAYALGCLTPGYYLVRWRTGQDLRSLGSGGVGATNVGRQLGARGFLITGVGDAAKAALAVGIARWLHPADWVWMLALIAVVAGHIWPLQLGFRGGKGIACGIGGLLIFDPILFVALLGLFVSLYLIVLAIPPLRRLPRNYYLPGVTIILAAPVYAWIVGHSQPAIGFIVLLVILLLWANLSNMQKLWRGRVKKGEGVKG